jgi:hypothetical protein
MLATASEIKACVTTYCRFTVIFVALDAVWDGGS